MTRTASMIVGTLILTPLTGCVQRTIHVTSEPQGALVYLNDQEVGRTPVEVPFTFYGDYEVRLERDGYEPLNTHAMAHAPWWENPGPDLLAEMIPGARSDVRWHFEMEQAEPVEDVELDPIIERAAALRDEVRRAAVTVEPDEQAETAEDDTP